MPDPPAIRKPEPSGYTRAPDPGAVTACRWVTRPSLPSRMATPPAVGTVIRAVASGGGSSSVVVTTVGGAAVAAVHTGVVASPRSAYTRPATHTSTASD